MTEQPTTTAFEQVLVEIAASRGIESIAELKERLRAAGYTETAEDLPHEPRGGDGGDLVKVLGLNQEEMVRISDAFVATFLRVGRLARDPQAQRSKIFEDITAHLDFVAMVDERDHGGSAAAERIRGVLIPFCEREGGLES